MATANSDQSTRANSPVRDLTSRGQLAHQSLGEMSHEAGEKIGAMASDFAKKAEASMDTGRHYVSENPLRSLGYAAATGVLAGSLLTLILSRRKS